MKKLIVISLCWVLLPGFAIVFDRPSDESEKVMIAGGGGGGKGGGGGGKGGSSHGHNKNYHGHGHGYGHQSYHGCAPPGY